MSTTGIAPWPVLARPMRGAPVRALQHLLRHHGATVVADGEFGRRTEAAVRTFQRDRSLAVDGRAGPATLARAIVTVRRGNRGEAVRAAQSLVADPATDPPDGVFGPATDAAVRRMQGVLDLVPDGIVGPLTWQALMANGD